MRPYGLRCSVRLHQQLPEILHGHRPPLRLAFYQPSIPKNARFRLIAAFNRNSTETSAPGLGPSNPDFIALDANFEDGYGIISNPTLLSLTGFHIERRKVPRAGDNVAFEFTIR